MQEKSQQKNKKTKSAAAEAIANGTIVCSETDTANIRKNLLAGKIIFSKCAAVNGKYEIRLLNENSKDLVVGNEGVSIRAGKAGGESVEVLMTSNPEQESELFSQNAEYSSAVKCLKTASPLYVDFRKDKSEKDVLSSPEDGVYFDILGANGFPTPYTKSKISWFARGKFALLTLPNFRGEVTNVDQLFGDNTMGPDGEFADNGFHALAKFDLNKDGVIDSSDAVFSKLRLWFDRNRNGTAEPKELESLGLRKLQSIDLKYDPDFYERDEFGNEIKFKSVVRFNDGSLKPIFDVWFRISQ